jgi:hypothetical protein
MTPFEAFDSASAIMAYIHTKSGPADLAELLATIDADQESMMRAADELAAAGLQAVADIVMEAAADAPLASAFCPYVPEDRVSYQGWHDAENRRRLRLAPVHPQRMNRPRST